MRDSVRMFHRVRDFAKPCIASPASFLSFLYLRLSSLFFFLCRKSIIPGERRTDADKGDSVYSKRFSEHSLFWMILGALFVFMIYFIYKKIVAVPRIGNFGIFWLVLNVIIISIITVSRRVNVKISPEIRKWADRICGVWIYFVIFSFIMLALFVTAGQISGHYIARLAGCLAVSFGLSGFAMLVGVYEASEICVTRLELPTQKLKGNMRVVQLTDLHLGPWSGKALLTQTVNKINEQNPDIVVVTGDLADGSLNGRTAEIEILGKISARLGIFAVTGNHEYYDNAEDAINFMKLCGMKVLRCEKADVGGILIVGAGDKDHLIECEWGLSRSERLVLSLEKEQKEKFLLLLRHRPIVEAGTLGHFDLQLSGHTHGGQLIPLPSSRLKIRNHSRGFKKNGGGYLYVSNGAGYVGPPVRLFAPPEILVVDLLGTAQTNSDISRK